MIGNNKNSKWQFPTPGHNTLNLDVAWISSSVPAGYAIIFRNDAGGFKDGRAGPISATSPEEAETLGFFHAAKWARTKNLSDFSVEGDCKSLIDYLNGELSQITWQNQTIMDEVRQEFSFCNNFKDFYFRPRTANRVIDTLAKEAKNFRTDFEWSNNPPSCILNDLEVDKSNVRILDKDPALDGSTLPVVRITNSLS